MQRYILGRLVYGLVSLLAVLAIVFVIARLRGSPVDVMLDANATPADRAALVAKYGLDRPLYEQYLSFVVNAARGDFGTSIKTGVPSSEMVLERLPATFQLAGVAILISLLIALPLGVYSAVHRGGPLDAIGSILAVLGQSLPLFWLGMVFIYIFAVELGWLPAGGRSSPSSVVLPAVTMGWYLSAGIMRLVRSSMLEVLDSEFIKLARVKGLSESIVVWKHAFKNTAVSVITFTVPLLVMMLGGSVVTETVFTWPGVGRLAIDSIHWRDFPVVQTVVVMLSATFITANLAVDILYAYLNPKIRYKP